MEVRTAEPKAANAAPAKGADALADTMPNDTLADPLAARKPANADAAADKMKRAQFERDRATLHARIAKLKGADGLGALFDALLDGIRRDKTDPQTGTAAQIVAAFHAINGFQVPYDWYVDNQTNPDFGTMRQEKATSSTGNARLWSKLNVRRSVKAAEQSGGVLLESSVAGVVFNGLMFGYGWGESAAISHLWEELSKNYVAGLHGTVEADVFEGRDPNSVLSREEIKGLVKLVEKGQIEALKVNIFEMRGNRFEVVETRLVKTLDEWLAIEQVQQASAQGPKVKFADLPPGEQERVTRESRAIGKIEDLPTYAERQRNVDKHEKMLHELSGVLEGRGGPG